MLVSDHQRDVVLAFLNDTLDEPCDKITVDKMSRGKSDTPGLLKH